MGTQSFQHENYSHMNYLYYDKSQLFAETNNSIIKTQIGALVALDITILEGIEYKEYPRAYE